MFEHGQLGLGENDPGAKARIAGRRSCSFSRKGALAAKARARRGALAHNRARDYKLARAGLAPATASRLVCELLGVLVPSDADPNALTALQASITDNAIIRAAVAFVTGSGVQTLADILRATSDVSVEITARAADVTEPEALLALRDDLGVDVSVVIGHHARAFHPKLWLIERADAVIVLSGSGNLTEGGLVTNDEQFELIEYQHDDALVEAHGERLDQLTRHAQPLDVVENTAIWREWLTVRKKQAQARRDIARIEKAFLEREPIADRSADKAKLIDDLQQIYDDTVAADLPRADGEQYYPTRLLVAINRARDGDHDPVKVVSDTIRRHTDGLDILLQAGRVDLTLELLVLEESKPYHELFGTKSIELARARIEEFHRAGHTIPSRAARPRARVDDVMSNEEVIAFLNDLVVSGPDGYALPVLHKAQAVLLKVDAGHAVVRRDSGSHARIPIRLVRSRLTQMANGDRFTVSELREAATDRFNSALAPLIAALPGVEFDAEDKQLFYDARNGDD